MSKRDAIETVNSHIGGRSLTHGNTCYSSINKTNPVRWLTIPVARFRSDLHLLLRERDGGLIWIRIPAGHFPDPRKVFRYRSERDAVSLELSCEKRRYLMELKGPGSVRLLPLVEHEFAN